MQTSPNGILFIARREGLVLTAYQDGPHRSIGFGHNSADLKEGDTITVSEAFALLKKDVKAREPTVIKALRRDLLQHQFDALMSLHYQSGNRYVHAVVALINAKELAVAGELFPLCDRNLAGEKSAGLLKRRLLERAVFERAEYPADLRDIPFWRGDPKASPRETYHVGLDDLT